MRQRCLDLHYPWKEPFWTSFVYNHQKHILLCTVFKAGTMSWYRLLLKLTGNPKAVRAANKGRNIRLKIYSYLGNMALVREPDRAGVLKSNYKILFVRDPLVRLISAYRDKILHCDKFEQHRRRMRVLQPNASTRFIRLCTDIYYTVHFPSQCSTVRQEAQLKQGLADRTAETAVSVAI